MGRWRITGVSSPVGGVQWEYRVGDAEIARRVISILEDRRMLWVDLNYEIPDECIRSAEKTREALTEQINTAGIGPELEAVLKQIRKLFANFMTTGAWGRDHPRYPYGADEFSVALGELRAAVGERLAVIVSTYGLDVDDDLRRVIPDTGAWFFEQFGDTPADAG